MNDGNAAGKPARNPTDKPGGGSLRQIVAIVVLLAALLAASLSITGALRGAATIQDCVAAGRTNCAPIR